MICGDAHVHIYAAFDLKRLFETALARARELGGAFVLLLTESAGHDYFGRLAAAARAGGALAGGGGDPPNLDPACLEGLRLETTPESGSLLLSDAHARVVLVAGRQILATRGIEVLALALEPEHPLKRVPDGTLLAAELVERVLDAGAIAVLPWGLGKWLGARGAEVALVASNPDFPSDALLFVGD